VNSVLLALFGFLVFFLGFRFYSTWLSKRIYGLDVDIKTPAHEALTFMVLTLYFWQRKNPYYPY
tara:strand:+ start:6311 stop:6502 length:192 start_codon:yes stop_codon:yes gene_type:complete